MPLTEKKMPTNQETRSGNKNRMTLVNPRGKTSKQISDLMIEALGLNDEQEDEEINAIDREVAKPEGEPLT